MNAIRDPFEPTPIEFHRRVERQLRTLPRESACSLRPLRAAAVLALCLLLLCGTALALRLTGVSFFLTERIFAGEGIDAGAVAQPVSQQLVSEHLDAFVRDAYWDGETLSVALHLSPKGDIALYTETDRGLDGEHFDRIWWKGEVLPFETWRAGRDALMLRLPALLFGGETITSSWDWIQEEQGETMLLSGRCSDLSQGAAFTILLPCTLNGDEVKPAELTFTLPPMTKGEPQ